MAEMSIQFTWRSLTLTSMDKNAHTSAQHGSILTQFTFLQNKMQMFTASSQLLLVCFPTLFSLYMNIKDTSWSIFLKIFLILLTCYIANKSYKFPNFKNIQESGNCSHLILLLNNNNKWIYVKHNIYRPKYCYKMKIVSILGWSGVSGQKWPMNQL